MERLQTLYGSVNAYINKLFVNGELQIHVSFIDNKNKLHILLMQKGSAKWKIAEQESIQAGLQRWKDSSIALLKTQ